MRLFGDLRPQPAAPFFPNCYKAARTTKQVHASLVDRLIWSKVSAGDFILGDENRLREGRSGLPGIWDQVVGPGVDQVENGLIVAAMIAGPGLVVAWARASGAGWAWWQWLVLVILASDLFGGMAANSLAPAKQWHHRVGQGPGTHYTFAALHIHPLLLSITVPMASPIRAALIVYGVMLLGAGLMLAIPSRLRGAVSLLFSAVAIAFCSIWLPLESPVGWFPTALYLKVLVAYLVPPDNVNGEKPASAPSGPWG